MMGITDLESLEARISQLERTNRKLVVALTALCLGPVYALSSGAARSQKTVEAQRFILKSSTGSVRAELTTLDGEYPVLKLSSPNGQREAEVSPLGLSFSDNSLPSKKPLAHYGDLGLYLTDMEGRTVAELGGAGTKTLAQIAPVPEISLLDKTGKTIWHAP